MNWLLFLPRILLWQDWRKVEGLFHPFSLRYNENDSPHPQVPVIFGLLNTNSEASFDSMKSISVPEITHSSYSCSVVCACKVVEKWEIIDNARRWEDHNAMLWSLYFWVYLILTIELSYQCRCWRHLGRPPRQTSACSGRSPGCSWGRCSPSAWRRSSARCSPARPQSAPSLAAPPWASAWAPRGSAAASAPWARGSSQWPPPCTLCLWTFWMEDDVMMMVRSFPTEIVDCSVVISEVEQLTLTSLSAQVIVISFALLLHVYLKY